jgi:hypothetical protein
MAPIVGLRTPPGVQAKGFSMGTEFMPLIFVILVAGIILVVRNQDIQRQRELYEEQARKRGGDCHSGGALFYPKLILPYGGQDLIVNMRPASRNSPASTFIRSRLSFLGPCRMKIYREVRIFGVSTVFGQDIRTGDAEFDDAFVVQGNDEMVVRAFLQRPVQASLLGIKEWAPQLEIKDGQFIFQVRRELKNTGDLDAFIEAGLGLLNRVQETG